MDGAAAACLELAALTLCFCVASTCRRCDNALRALLLLGPRHGVHNWIRRHCAFMLLCCPEAHVSARRPAVPCSDLVLLPFVRVSASLLAPASAECCLPAERLSSPPFCSPDCALILSYAARDHGRRGHFRDAVQLGMFHYPFLKCHWSARCRAVSDRSCISILSTRCAIPVLAQIEQLQSIISSGPCARCAVWFPGSSLHCAATQTVY